MRGAKDFQVRIMLYIYGARARAYLNETSINQNPRTECIEDTTDNACSGTSRVIRTPYAEAGGDTDGSGDAVQECTDDRDV